MARPEATRVPGFFTWRTLDRAATDALLAANTHTGLLDDDSFYQQARLIDHADRMLATAMFRRSHGTHLMGLAA